MIDFLTDIDQSVFLFFNSFHSTFFDSFMSMYSGRFIWIPMYAALLAVMLCRFTLMQTIVFIVGIALAVTLADQICASVIRPVFQRLRPSNPGNPLSLLTHIVNGYRGGAYGFPSCHAANSFALAVFAALMLRRRRFTVFIFAWAAVNVYSRVYLGVHYPGDLLAGAVVGSVSALACYGISGLIIRRWAVGYSPAFDLTHIPVIRCLPVGLNIMVIVGVITLLYITVSSLCSSLG